MAWLTRARASAALVYWKEPLRPRGGESSRMEFGEVGKVTCERSERERSESERTERERGPHMPCIRHV